ncbi:wax ester/triacylglycerol synthase family O-acyltransferase [Nocardia tengchongensis]|uniref:wax ester/triacylglycerol synthase family O-acyltransferase n=1 Tax=Nocardia tengchongensis TaxID=2055889 RepID=UPI003623284C
MERHRSHPSATRLHLFDAGWLWLESDSNLMHASVLAVCRKPEGCEEDFVPQLVANLRSHRAPAPPYDVRLRPAARGLAWPRWESVDVLDTDHHVRYLSLLDGDGLLDVVSRLQGIPLDRATPLWTVHVIEGFDDENFAVFGKLHHAIADGMTGAELLRRWFSEDPAETAKPPVWSVRPTRTARQATAGRSRRVLGPIVSAGHLIASIPAMVRAARVAPTGSATRPWTGPRTALNSVIDAERRIATRSFEIDEFRAVAQAVGGTINDVLLAACSGALRGYLTESCALPKTPLVTNIPISIRHRAHYEHAGNAITWARIALGTDTADPGHRLESIVAATRAVKARLSRLRGPALTAYTLLVTLPILLEHLLRLGGRARPLFNVPVSNVPGPANPLYLNGSEVVSLHAMTVLYNGQGLNVVCLSYGTRLEVCFTACPAAVPDVDRLAELCDQSFTELRHLYQPRNEG